MASPRNFFLRRFFWTLFFLGTSATASAGEWQHETVTMAGVQNYFMERCVKFGAGTKVEFSFTSKYAVNFDVHHHPGNTIVFVTKKEGIHALSESFLSAADDHYCFTWANPVDVGNDWDITLKHRVVTQ
jgi:hypothetical protein